MLGVPLKCQDSFILQKDNVANQREHLILLLANIHVRLRPKPTLNYKVFHEFSSKLAAYQIFTAGIQGSVSN